MAHHENKTMSEKLEEASPYNIFYNKIPALPETDQTNSIEFKDLLCPSLGKLKSSLQIVMKVDIAWLVKQYQEMNLGTEPLTVLYGEEKPEMEKYADEYLSNVTLHCVAVDGSCRYGSHHSKIGIFLYDDDSLRVVIYTSNLFQEQWDHHNHSFWVSPLCRRLASKSSGESPTKFKSSLLAYLKEYRLEILEPWIDHVQNADFSEVKVFLVTTVPGSHPATERKSYLTQVRHILKQHCVLPTDESENSRWPVIVQTPSLGHFGTSPGTWLLSTFLRAVAVHSRSTDEYRPRVPLKIVFPSKDNVEGGRFGTRIFSEGNGLRYLAEIHDCQKWLESYLFQWKADHTGRSKVMPHTKIYCRVSPCYSKMAWFMLSTCNVSRGPWGREDTRRGVNNIYARNWEVGVMFLPKFFGEEYFKIKSDLNERVDEKIFPLVYDLPLVKYGEKDKPWTSESLPGLNRKTY